MRVVNIYTSSGNVSVQWITDDVGIIRYHGTEGGFGSPFSFSATIKKNGDVAEFYSGQGNKYTRSIAKAIHNAIRNLGMKKIHYERHKKHSYENTIIL